ncbi:hypothetical protein IW510_12455 [Enterococcus sp. BWR-S5]|nr:hypothetical protein [Enterococcus sp. BWR-S5]
MTIVRNGTAAIRKVLERGSEKEKERLLFCLDRYLDPWFEYNLSYKAEIDRLLEEVIVTANTLAVKESALQLLTDYGEGDFKIIKENIDKIEPELMSEINYLLEMIDFTHKGNEML